MEKEKKRLKTIHSESNEIIQSLIFSNQTGNKSFLTDKQIDEEIKKKRKVFEEHLHKFDMVRCATCNGKGHFCFGGCPTEERLKETTENIPM